MAMIFVLTHCMELFVFFYFCICLDVCMVVYGIVKYVKEGGRDGNCNDD